MGPITLKNVRASSDITVNLRLKDGGMYIAWTSLSDIKAYIFSDVQRAIAGRCDVSIDGDDSTLLICNYSANKPQYPGVNSIVIRANYDGRLKTYDRRAFNIVKRTSDVSEDIVLNDPVVDLELEVEDVSSSLLDMAIALAFKAVEEWDQVTVTERGPEGKSAYRVAVDNGFVGTEEEWLLSLQGKSAYEIAVELGYEGTEEQWIASLKGEDGEPGTTPHIGQNGNWFIGDTDTNVVAEGQDGAPGQDGSDGTDGTDGITPHIGQNGHWFIGDTDTNVVAEGQDGEDGADGSPGITPHIGANNHWFIGETDTGILAEGTDGVTPDISIGTVTTVEPGTPAAASMTGTPEAPVLNLSIPKGLVGATPNITVGTVTTGQPGTPVVVTITGTPEAPVLNITIPQGMQGNTGSSVNYPYELVNNLTTNDATKGLSAAQGVVLDGKVSQLEHEVDLLVANIKVLYNDLGAGAFWGNKPVIDWGGETVPITVSLTNCTIDNDAESVNIGRSYYATLTPATGYILGEVEVTMGSTSVPVVNGVIDIDEVTGPITIVAAGANLDSVAYDNKTYRQIFETNNSLGITPGFENGSYSPLVVAQGTPTITDEDSDSGTYSLKVDCSGASANLKTSTSSKPACFNAYRIKVTSYVAGDFGMQNKNDQSVYQQAVCDWKTIAFHRTALSSAVAVFIGCYNSANGTAYIDTPVVVLDRVFSTAPTLTKFTELYDNYVAIKKLA